MDRKILPDEQPFRDPRPVRERYADDSPQPCQAKGCDGEAEMDELFCVRHQLTDAF
jgi:hypothetical protein